MQQRTISGGPPVAGHPLPWERVRVLVSSPLTGERATDGGGRVRGLLHPHRTLRELCSGPAASFTQFCCSILLADGWGMSGK
jgi:hypothetical protein